ncbi:MAG TPA: YfhO family protein [Erysipelotrichaceae bacterium]|nr:YfhO family protein [Erysipelotrichaceae bacterium]
MEVVFEKDKKRSDSLGKKIRDLFGKTKKNIKLPDNFYYFLFLLVVSVGFYMMMLVDNNFSLAYGGDYSAQYIPMGYHVWDYYHDWIQTGHFTLFDTELYLGANSFGSNAYYGLFSPFNIIIVLFPRTVVPQSMAISSMIKLACAGLFFSLYMSKAFKVKDNIARVCGVAYAFAGWGAFYLWYNNYQDILVFFPLVLLGIEKVLQEEKPWLLSVGVFFLTICNYVLMVPYVICAFFYAMFRFFQRVPLNEAKTNFKILGLGVLGFAGGLLMSLFVFAPAFLATLSSPKLDSYSYIGTLKEYLLEGQHDEFLKLLFSWGSAPDQHRRVFPTRALYPILEFFFPATTCRSLPTLELNGWDFDDIAVSLWCYVPFIMFLVPALIQSGKEKKWSIYVGLGLLLISLFTPVMYYLTMGFTNSYARWTLFIVTSLIAYVGIYLDKIPHVAKWHIHVGFAFAIVGIVTSWILTYVLANTNPERDGQLIFRFIDDHGFNFTSVAFIIELVYVTIVYLVLLFLYNKKFFHVLLMLFVSLEAICMGNFVTIGHGYDTNYNNGYAHNERFRSVVTKIQKKDKSFYRMYASINDAYSVNNSFINGYNSVSFFHSLYNFEIDDFSLWTGIRSDSKSVAGNYRGKYQDLDNLLGVKYYITSKRKNRYQDIEDNNPQGFIDNVPFDFVENKQLETSEFFVYENPTLSKFGYSYDTICNEGIKKYNRGEVEVVKNSAILSSTAFVSPEDGLEIARNHSDITLADERPVNTSIKQMTLDTDYLQFFYNLEGTASHFPFKNIPNIPSNFETTSFDYDHAMDYFVFLKSKHLNEPLLKANTAFYVRAPFSGSQKYNFHFLDENNKIFMFDSHDDDTTDNVSYMRGFYIRKDVYTLAICGKYYASYLTNDTLRLYQEDLSDYETRRNALNADPIENVKYSPDKFTFETHYNKEKFVVSRTAFDIGWKIKAKDMNTDKNIKIDTYKGNGGFVSFVAPEGDISYTMVYETPYLKISSLISHLSITAFFLSLCGYYVYLEKKRIHYLDSLHR